MKRIAVIGAGIAGMTAAYLLSRRHTVSLFERRTAARRSHAYHPRALGRWRGGARHRLSGSQRAHLPEPGAAVRRVGRRDAPSDMSFSVSVPSTGLEYSSRGALGLLRASRAMSSGSITTGCCATSCDSIARRRRCCTTPGAEELDAGRLLERERYGEAFTTQYLVPMTSAIWSASVDSMAVVPGADARALHAEPRHVVGGVAIRLAGRQRRQRQLHRADAGAHGGAQSSSTRASGRSAGRDARRRRSRLPIGPAERLR